MIESKLRTCGGENTSVYPGLGVDGNWLKSTATGPISISSAYGSTGWKGLIYGNTGGNLYRFPPNGTTSTVVGNPTAPTRQMGTIRNNIVWGTLDSDNPNSALMNVMKLDSGGDNAGITTATLPFAYNGIFSTNHPDLLGFIHTNTFYLLTVNCNSDGHYIGYGSYTTHSIPGAAADNSYNGGGGCFDIINGRLYINRWGTGTLAFQEYQASSTGIAVGTPFSLSFERYVEIPLLASTISGGLDPYTGRMVWCYHGDGQVWYKDRAIATYPLSYGGY